MAAFLPKQEDQRVQENLTKELGLDYSNFATVYPYKQICWWYLNNWVDTFGLAKRICNDFSNLIIAEPVKITTVNPAINKLIENELMGRLNLNGNLAKFLPQMMGMG
ncbi:MAG: hypothetical protein HUJ52_03650, partial [Malacoplasma sp.]|nr:hypothetical protein [Malacoplasma sp.]